MNNYSNNLPNIIFYGTPNFSAKILEFILESKLCNVLLVVTQPDRESGRGKNLTACPVKEIAIKNNIPVFQPERIRKEKKEFKNLISNLTSPINLAIVVAFGQIIPEDLLNIPTKGSLNIHASLLPRWRGAAPIQRAIIAGDTETGVCLMKMDAGLDTGDVYCKDTFPISLEDTAGSIYEKMLSSSKILLKNELFKIIFGKTISQPQALEGVTYAEKIDNSFGNINWNLDSLDIHNLIRGLSPFPSAYTFIHKKRLKIFKSNLTEKSNSVTFSFSKEEKSFKSGQIYIDENFNLFVKCKNTFLQITELQLEGKKVMPANEFCKGNFLKTSDLFSNT